MKGMGMYSKIVKKVKCRVMAYEYEKCTHNIPSILVKGG
jgi:hypothetical protein